MKLTATSLRANLYKILDKVIETGVPIQIERKGQFINLVPAKKRNKLDNLQAHPNTISGDPNDIVHMDWSEYWNYEDDIS